MVGRRQTYMVHWKGFSRQHDTREPRSSLMRYKGVKKLIINYEKKHKNIWKN